MSHGCSGGSEGGAIRRNGVAVRVADALALAASPTFAMMALLTAVIGGGSSGMLGMTTHASRVSGMATMYLLMSAFHASAWLKLIGAGRVRKSPVFWRRGARCCSVYFNRRNRTPE